MSEMLGNYYFMSGRYPSACRELEQVLNDEPDNLQVMQKLVVCYLQMGLFNRSLDLFYRFISLSPESVRQGVTTEEDCPCIEALEEMQGQPETGSPFARQLRLGILWYFKDPAKAAPYFEKLAATNPSNPKLVGILSHIQKH